MTDCEIQGLPMPGCPTCVLIGGPHHGMVLEGLVGKQIGFTADMRPRGPHKGQWLIYERGEEREIQGHPFVAYVFEGIKEQAPVSS